MLSNLASLSPEPALSFVEKAAATVDHAGPPLIKRIVGASAFASAAAFKLSCLLQHLACEGGLFSRSVKLLCRLSPGDNSIESLFYAFSYTAHASLETRAAVIKDVIKDVIKELVGELVGELVRSADPDDRAKGISFLRAALKTRDFRVQNDHSAFGARPRQLSAPRTRDDRHHWYGTFITLCVDGPVAAAAGDTLVQALPDLSAIESIADLVTDALVTLPRGGRSVDHCVPYSAP